MARSWHTQLQASTGGKRSPATRGKPVGPCETQQAVLCLPCPCLFIPHPHVCREMWPRKSLLHNLGRHLGWVPHHSHGGFPSLHRRSPQLSYCPVASAAAPLTWEGLQVWAGEALGSRSCCQWSVSSQRGEPGWVPGRTFDQPLGTDLASARHLTPASGPLLVQPQFRNSSSSWLSPNLCSLFVRCHFLREALLTTQGTAALVLSAPLPCLFLCWHSQQSVILLFICWHVHCPVPHWNGSSLQGEIFCFLFTSVHSFQHHSCYTVGT